ncbi:hypothetical protein BGZ54_005425 [Gamsiella multidivaricata]|nr:hypothetical protein BGZ54_005425 [Gamsiella multidivaricata]
MVSLIHGLNLKGVILAMTMYMLKPYIEKQNLIAALNPPTVPSIVFLAPLASFCSAFGVLWLLYDLFGYLHASTDDLRDFFGITLPAPSIVTLKDVKDRSVTLNWQCSSQATISKHLIEIDGLIIGESGKQETSVVIQGLYPDNIYRIRLWAITTRNWKTPSDYIVVRTLASVPVELELSSAENIRRESELIKKLIKESEDMHQLNKEPEQDNLAPESQPVKAGKSDSGSSHGSASTGSGSPPSSSAIVAAVETAASVDARVPSPSISITEEQISSLKVELEGKEASHALLIQQLVDHEQQYRQQEDSLKSEIASLREQQKQEEEPRQLAKTKLKELQESLREAETHKSKMEKEHRMEVDRRQRMTEQLEAKQRKLESLEQTLRQNEDKLQQEMKSHHQQVQELAASLKMRSEEVKAGELSLKALQDSQKTLRMTIESKELELQTLQATIHSPKGHVAWEQKVKGLDQERLAEATKNVAKVRSTREVRKAQNEARKMGRLTASEAYTAPALGDHQSLDYGSSWVSAGWNQSPGTKILSGLFQDDSRLGDVRPTPVRKITGPPPGLSPKMGTPEAIKANGTSTQGYGRERKNSGSQSTLLAPGSPSRSSAQLSGHPKPQRQNSGLRPRSSSIMSSESPFIGEPSGLNVSRYSDMIESPIMESRDDGDRLQGLRSRASSISSLTGFQSPLFEPSFVFSTHVQPQLDPNGTNQIFQQPIQNRQPTHGRQQSSQGHNLSPRARFQGAGQLHSPPVMHMQSHWGGSNAKRTKAGPVSVAEGGRPSMAEFDARTSPSIGSGQPYNYHRFFGSSSSTDLPSDMFSSTGSPGDHQWNEQNVIESMFESPETLDLRHHLRTVGSHSSLGSQSKILPSHLRSISTPGTSSPLSSPTAGTLPSFQPSPPLWDIKPIARPGTLGRMNGQAEGSSSSLNISDPSSPTAERGLWGGSGVSSMDTGSSLPVDALVFADHYFSNRGHRGFDAPSPLSSTSFASPTTTQTRFDTATGSASRIGMGRGQDEKMSQTMSSTGNESDIFGYGLKLNPFGWTIPNEGDNSQDK